MIREPREGVLPRRMGERLQERQVYPGEHLERLVGEREREGAGSASKVIADNKERLRSFGFILFTVNL